MASRMVPMRAATSTQARAIESYYPFYPPPPIDEGQMQQTGSAVFQTLPLSYIDERTDKGIVDRHNLRVGEWSRYTHGNVQRQGLFHMIATGQVESTIVQQFTNMPSIAQFNNWLYRAAKGYPMNLGLSEKVPTLPQEALGNNPNGAMQPRQHITRNIFTRRSYNSVKTIPAQPQSR